MINQVDIFKKCKDKNSMEEINERRELDLNNYVKLSFGFEDIEELNEEESESESEIIEPDDPKIRREKFLIEVQNVFCKVDIFPKLIEEIMRLYDDRYYTFGIDKNFKGKKLIHLIIGLYYEACRRKRIARTLDQVVGKFKHYYPDVDI